MSVSFKSTINADDKDIIVKDLVNAIGSYAVGIIKIEDSDGNIVYKNADYDTPAEIVEPDIILVNTNESSPIDLPISSSGEIQDNDYTVSYKVNVGVSGAAYPSLTISSPNSYTIRVAGISDAYGADIRKLGILTILSGALAGTYTITSRTFTSTGAINDFVIGETVAVVSGYSGSVQVFSSVTTEEGEYELLYSPSFQPVSIDLDVDYLLNKLTSTDATVYNIVNNGTSYAGSVVRQHKITPPPDATYSVVTTTSQIKELFNIWTNYWTTTISSSVTWDISAYFAITKTLSGSDSIKVEVSDCGCHMLTCINNLYNKWVTSLSTNPSLTKSLGESLTKVVVNWNLYNQARDCGEDYEGYCNVIKSVLSANDCSCASAQDTASQPLVSPVSPDYGTTLLIVSGIPGDEIGDDGNIALSDNKKVYEKINSSWVETIDYNPSDNAKTWQVSYPVELIPSAKGRLYFPVLSNSKLVKLSYTVLQTLATTSNIPISKGADLITTITVLSSSAIGYTSTSAAIDVDFTTGNELKIDTSSSASTSGKILIIATFVNND